jgi:hypothetical protein
MEEVPMERARMTSGERRRRQRFSMAAWAKRNLAPYWGLWLVGLATFIAFVVVILWFAL